MCFIYIYHKFVVVIYDTNLGWRIGCGNRGHGSIIWVIVPRKIEEKWVVNWKVISLMKK